ncbi:hypothetical protein EHQ12_13130 [Leptospira gomenensis]|uniref:DUF5683 domain-containing protein n=1 Tax=Leptospira gomenensis TaxID=2484974 RepID=A0A5F1Y6J7_9LEPT|nr:hypothetical protein [Leptospira gomenensis]TGK28134.1 hypothetical protein EHQ17_18830 [Leptospira gomenensis]TGK37010.1 hypothetical protein EHQ12_13130 [Leptospira gomenensis]TGK45646.1 hypothetical protein EHQ07_08145 [Leptospira gomenensis]TGK59585.1 hypothetical protein EHQ13_12355 [Leptospira gomenensis]
MKPTSLFFRVFKSHILDRGSVSFFRTLFLAFSICGFSGLKADTVILRSGTEYKNVKTILGKSSVKIDTESGSSFQVPISSIKSIKSQPVKWSASPSNAVSASETETNPEPLKNSELMRLTFLGALPSLIPGWSNLYINGHPLLGSLFSIAEIYLVSLVSVYAKPTVTFYEESGNIALAYYNLFPNGLSQNPSFAAILVVEQQASLVKDPMSGGYTTHSKLQESRERAISGLIGVLFLDFSLTQILSYSSKTKPQTAKESGDFDIRFGGGKSRTDGELESKFSLNFYF